MEVPLWVAILQAANNDPLRAQEIEAGVNKLWWDRYQTYIELQDT